MVAVYTTPFQVYAGDAWSQAFRMTVQPDPDDPATEPEDLSGYSDWACQWRSTAGAATAIDLTVDASDAATGVIVVRASGDVGAVEGQTREMGGNGVFDLEAVLAGETRTFIRAKTRWSLDVTRG